MRNLAIAFTLTTVAAGAETVTIAALGDSLTQGYGLRQDDGLVPQLQNWLETQGADVVVLNAGVSGDTTAGGLSRVDWTLTDDVDAMIVALGGNDVLRGLSPDEARANLDGILTRAGEKSVPVLLVGISVPGNYGPDYKARFEAIYPDLAGKHDSLLYPDLVAPITTLPDRATALATYVQPDGVHPNADGVTLIVEALGPQVLDLIDQVR